MKAERISQGAAVEQSQAGGNGAQGNEVGEKFSQLLHELLGVSGPTGMYGAAVNPMDFAPAPVGTVVEAPKGPPVQVEQEAPQEEAASEEEVVKEETQAQDAAPEERQPEGEAEVVEVVEAMTTTAAQVVETEAVAVQAVVETQATAEVAVTEEVVVDEVPLERIAEEVVQKESGAGQGKPDLSVVQEAAKVVAVDHQRRFGDGTEAPQTEEQLMAYKQTERATVEFSQASADTQVPQEMQEQIVQQEVVNRQPTPKPQVRPLNDVLGQEPQAQPDASELADQLLAAQNAAIDAVVKDMKLPKGSGAEQSLRFQLGSLFRPDIPVETLGNHGAAKNIVADAVTAISGAGEKGADVRNAAHEAKKRAVMLPKADQQQIVDKVKDLLQQANAARNGNTMTVRLEPAELGALTVRVTHKAGRVFARIAPDTPEVEQVLRNKIPELTQALTAAGLRADDIHVSIGQERSESESFGFQEFLGNPGQFEEGAQREGFSRQHSGGHATLLAEPMEHRQLMLDSGWVA